MSSHLLTKSKYMTGLSCLRSLWYEVNAKDKLPEASEADQFRMDQGNEVGEWAKKLYPAGIDLADVEFSDNIKKTQDLIKKRSLIFEAGIQAGRIYSRADILTPVEDEFWDVIEVKGSNSVKPEHYDDLAFQLHCYTQSGLKIRNCWLMHLNKDYQRKGDIDPKKLFILEDITTDVKKTMEGIEERIEKMLKAIDRKTPPEKCERPSACPYPEVCWGNIPEIFDLYYGGNLSVKLYAQGISAIKDISAGTKLSDRQKIQLEATKTGKPSIDRQAVQTFLKSLRYPIYHLDFETFDTAVPMFDGLRPWQKVAFQYSLHTQSKKDVKHHEFLYDGTDDPRPDFLKDLKSSLGDSGTIMAYNSRFEITILRELARDFPKYAKWADSVVDRFVDLLEPFNSFAYYHPAQQGSCSLKAVLPAVTGKGYSDLAIKEGSTASLEFFKLLTMRMPDSERKRIRADLEKYCGRDTESMVWIVEKLSSIDL